MSDYFHIQNAIQSFFEAVDQSDWARARDLMRAPFHIDYSSYGAGPAADLDPNAILEGWQGVLPGFDATHHQLGPLVIEVDGNQANVRAYVTALHFIEGTEDGPLWIVVGTYDITLERWNERWHLHSLTFNFKFQDGNPDLPALAAGRVAAGL